MDEQLHMDLKETINQNAKKIEKYRTLYEQNETTVCHQLINPILKALGWNTENPDEVQPNVSTEEGRPDYTLIKNQNPILFIEAKKLLVNVNDAEVLNQLGKYAFGEGVSFSVATNGVKWILVRSFEEGIKAKDRKIWEIDLEEKTNLEKNIRKLTTLSKENIENLDELIKKSQSIEDTWKSLVDEQKSLTTALTEVLENKLTEITDFKFDREDIEKFVEDKIQVFKFEQTHEDDVMDIEESNSYDNSHFPTGMKIQKDYFSIRNANEILINTAEWLIKKGKLKTEIPSGHRRNLISKIGKHRHGDPFIAGKKLSNGWYIETNYSTPGCIKYSRRLLEEGGFRGQDLKIIYK